MGFRKFINVSITHVIPDAKTKGINVYFSGEAEDEPGYIAGFDKGVTPCNYDRDTEEWLDPTAEELENFTSYLEEIFGVSSIEDIKPGKFDKPLFYLSKNGKVYFKEFQVSPEITKISEEYANKIFNGTITNVILGKFAIEVYYKPDFTDTTTKKSLKGLDENITVVTRFKLGKTEKNLETGELMFIPNEHTKEVSMNKLIRLLDTDDITTSKELLDEIEQGAPNIQGKKVTAIVKSSQFGIYQEINAIEMD